MRFTWFISALLSCVTGTSLTDYMAAKHALLGLPDAEMRVAGENLRWYRIHQPSRSSRYDGFQGFSNLSVLPLIRDLLSTPSAIDTCMHLFEWLMVGRPDWIYFHRTEITKLRICTFGLIQKLTREEHSSSLSLLDPFFREVLNALYDTETEKAMREERSSSAADSPVLFRQYMLNLLGPESSSSPLLTRIAASLNTPIDLGVLEPSQGEFFNNLGASNYNAKYVDHYGEFLTSVFGTAAQRGTEGQTLGFFKIAIDSIPNFDAIDARITHSEILESSPAGYAVGRTSFYYAPGMGRMRGLFMDFPGSFINLLWIANADIVDGMAAIDACMPVGYVREPVARGTESAGWQIGSNLRQLYNAMDTYSAPVTLMTCLIEGVLSERISMPVTDSDFNRAAASLVYGLLVTRSAGAATL